MTTPAQFVLSPGRRPLRVYAFDPSRGRLFGNEMQLDVRYRPLRRGPVDISHAHDRVAVIDYDVSQKKFYRAVDLDDPAILISNGFAPSESDPRFHQQMVYAVANDTIEQFELALGRRIHWRRAERPLNAKPGWLPDDILCLNLYPHAMHQANAFYSPDAHGILFGYFSASKNAVGLSVPGQTIFTCLSHDVIVHEMTHAILDGMRGCFMEQTNRDVAAFHEAFADLAALFRHFSHREVLLDAIQRTGGRLYTPALKGNPLADQAASSGLDTGNNEANPLIELAAQFGEAGGAAFGLRSAIAQPKKTMKDLLRPMDCHERGSILVAAVFDAFFKVYLSRAAKSFRIFRSAGGSSGDRDDVTSPLADALCDAATVTAQEFFRICVRAIDYLPPVDVTFGDFLRAVLTAQADYDPDDKDDISEAWMQSFRRRLILPTDAAFFSVDGLLWPEQPDEPLVPGIATGGPLGYDEDEKAQTIRALRAFIDSKAKTNGVNNAELLGLAPHVPYTIPSFHPAYRTDRNGSVRWDLVVEIVQKSDGKDGFPLRGGTTMIISTHGTRGSGPPGVKFLRYAIKKPLHGPEGQHRGKLEREYMADEGIDPTGKQGSLRVNFAFEHADNDEDEA
jgi:hypothetical protein